MMSNLDIFIFLIGLLFTAFPWLLVIKLLEDVRVLKVALAIEKVNNKIELAKTVTQRFKV